jgi:hypothetical protein
MVHCEQRGRGNGISIGSQDTSSWSAGITSSICPELRTAEIRSCLESHRSAGERLSVKETTSTTTADKIESRMRC